jgi:hypothetical protein
VKRDRYGYTHLYILTFDSWKVISYVFLFFSVCVGIMGSCVFFARNGRFGSFSGDLKFQTFLRLCPNLPDDDCSGLAQAHRSAAAGPLLWRHLRVLAEFPFESEACTSGGPGE